LTIDRSAVGPATSNDTHGSERIDDQQTDYRPHCFWRAHRSHRGHLCCRRCSAMVGRDDFRPCSARDHCSRHGSSYCRISKFQHANSRLENSTSPSTRRDRKTRRDNPSPSSAISKNTTDPSGWWSRNEEDRVHLLNANKRQIFAGMSDSPLCRTESRCFAPAIGVAGADRDNPQRRNSVLGQGGGFLTLCCLRLPFSFAAACGDAFQYALT
jgi:hypothetical protein